MDKREQVERALRQRAIALWDSKSNDEQTNYGWNPQGGIEATIDALTEQAIVIECEVEHIPGYDTQGHTDWVTGVRGCSPLVDGYLDIDGMTGTPGKALAIIIPLEEE